MFKAGEGVGHGAKMDSLQGLGAVLSAAPHLVGAPLPAAHDSAVPAALAASFAANSLAMMALFCVVLGLTLGWAMSRPNNAVES